MFYKHYIDEFPAYKLQYVRIWWGERHFPIRQWTGVRGADKLFRLADPLRGLAGDEKIANTLQRIWHPGEVEENNKLLFLWEILEKSISSSLYHVSIRERERAFHLKSHRIKA